MKPLYQTLTDLSHATGHAVSRTVGNVTAGVGNVASSVVPGVSAEREAPKVHSYASDEAHEKFKKFNTELNLKLNSLREWNSYLGTAVFWLMAAAMGIATKGVILENSIQMGALIAGVTSYPFLVVAGVTLALGAVKMMISQYTTKVQTEKGMDVSDFHLKREAELTGEAVGKQVSEKVGKSSEVTPEEPIKKLLENAVIKASPKVHSVQHDGMQHEAMAAKGMLH